MSVQSRLVSVVLIVACVVAAGTPALAQTDGNGLDETEPAVVIELHQDGSAAFQVRYTFDLTDEARAAAFTELQTNDTAVAAFEERFQSRIATVAAAADRNMSIEDVDLTLRSFDNTGVAELSVTWRNLGGLDSDRLIVTEPFASGFVTHRPVVVHAPTGYEIVSVAPDPDARDRTRAIWAAGSDLDGFEVVLEPTRQTETRRADAAGGETGGASGPGFGPIAVLVAAALGLGLFVRRG